MKEAEHSGLSVANNRDESHETSEDDRSKNADAQNGKETREKNNLDCQKEFSILGSHDFVQLRPIKFTSSWINDAVWFPAAIKKENLERLETIAGIPQKLYDACQSQITHWFPVQAAVLPYLLREIAKPSILRPRDVAVASPTGSGKTLCYAIPCLAAVGTRPRNYPVALVVVPVLNLVKQVEKEMNRFNAYNARIFTMYGSDSYETERKRLFGEKRRVTADIIIATPDRLVRHLSDQDGELDISHVRLLIADEADRMGELLRLEWLGLVEKKINSSPEILRATSLQQISRSRCAPRKILLSATLSKDVEKLKLWALHRPQLFSPRWDKDKIETPITSNVTSNAEEYILPESINHHIICCNLKFHPLYIYKEMVRNSWKRVLIFSNQKKSSERLSQVLSQLANSQFQVAHLTGDLYGKRRAKVLNRFQTGEKNVLIASDVLSRGIDLPNIDVVLNYDCPQSELLLVHRAGRTGRAGLQGLVITLIEKAQLHDFKFMLKKSGLLKNVCEEIVEDKIFDDELLSKYQQALAQAKEQLEARDKQIGKKAEHNRIYLANKMGRRKRNKVGS